ncbi:ADP-ribosylglycohydrolase [Nannocystis exedens]|uniref:ADP-ribosylglycohydrolase n=1 Tax=Nannocystis exedens TaxID=54 RepID=A0A1I2E4E5_9BACT|nr:ADP-ribosylglycohydrolase family protein [Nannocystis exedens]PCC69265.1 ADP-ribosylglycohydrolase [Nannocystis exedens]SFE87506.1 ADP-ribosylglycohydrolase [Nannocystis exedens]
MNDRGAGLLRVEDIEFVADDARLSSCVTHPHLRSQLCCALYCLWARGVLRGEPVPWTSAVTRLRAHLATEPDAELEFHIRPDNPPLGRGSGYVVDSLRSARMVLEAGSYEAVVKAAVALGDDTDTTAAIAGLRDGLAAIPGRWRDALRGRELLDPILAALPATS